MLLSYRDENGHINVPQSHRPLGPWVNRQRIEHSRYVIDAMSSRVDDDDDDDVDGTGRRKRRSTTTRSRRRTTSMTARRKEMLDEIGFVWDAMGQSWNAHYVEL